MNLHSCFRCSRNYYKHGMCLVHYNNFRENVFRIVSKDRLAYIFTLMENKLGKAHYLYITDRIKESNILYCELDALVFFKREVEIYILAQERYNN